MRHLFVLFLGILFGATGFAAPSAKTAQTVAAVKQHLNNFRLQITLFEQDKSQNDRSVDVMVTQDDDANAEGLMNHAQALRVLDALAADGFFERAKEMQQTKWEPPQQPFYVVWVRFDDTPGIYEFRTGDATLTRLLETVRDALAKGLAALSADRAVAALDSHRRRWQPSTDSKLPTAPLLSPGSSPLHPGYSFVPIDNSWKVRETYLKPLSGSFVSSAVADQTTLDDYKSWFHELTYSKTPDDRDCKIVIQYPSGHVYSEVDSYAYGVDVPLGDVYQRLFSVDGNIIFYSHSKDGKTIEAAAFDDDGITTGHVQDGKGLVRQPTFDPECSDATWYYQGLVLLDRHLEKGHWTSQTLNDNTESGHAASLILKPDGSETLFQDELEWQRQPDGTIKRETLYRPETDSPSASKRKQEYSTARKKFLARFVARAAAAGFSLEDLWLEPQRH